jgi:DNA-directed RNA polymerase specialized sigma24 family protein
MNRLPLDERRAVVGLMAGYSLREVSRLMGLGTSATPARRLFERALERLEEELNGGVRGCSGAQTGGAAHDGHRTGVGDE